MNQQIQRTLICIALSLVCVLAFSQERINKPKDYIQFEKTTKALKKVIGYCGVGGEWESYKNTIHHARIEDAQEFKKLSVKTTTYNDTLYYVLIRNWDSTGPSGFVVKSGDVYRYYSGGGRTNRDVLYFFTASEFEQIFNLGKQTKTIYSFRTYDQDTKYGKSQLSELPAFLLQKRYDREIDFMQIRIADDGKMVRFLLPYHKDEGWTPKDYDLFPECYFEMPLKDFNKWLEPVRP